MLFIDSTIPHYTKNRAKVQHFFYIRKYFETFSVKKIIFLQITQKEHAGFLRNPSPFGVTSYKPKQKTALESELSDAVCRFVL